MQRSLFCRFSFALAAVIAATFAAQAETYYWIGGDLVTNVFSSTASMWATEDGKVVDSVPVNDAANTLVFTNADAIAFKTDAVVWDGGIVKRGAGELCFTKALTLNGTLTLERGRFKHWNGGELTLGDNFSLVVTGSGSKELYIYGGGWATHRNLVIPYYSETPDAVNTMTFNAYGSTNMVTTLKSVSTRFSADVYCNNHNKMYYTLDWNPDEPATLEIVNHAYSRASDQKASIRVSRGTIRFAEGSQVNGLYGIEVASGAALEVTKDSNIDSFGCPLKIEDGGVLKVCRRQMNPTGGVTYNGTPVSDGRYQAADFNWLDGDGALYVGTVTIPDEPATTTATWDGGGGADTLLTTPANWVGDVAPNLTDGSLVAAFPTGTEATVPAGETVAFKGISVSATSFTLKGGEGSKVAFGSSGVTVTGAAFTNECFTAITRSQTWEVATNCEFAAAGEVAAEWPTIDELTLSGDGKYIILASNPRFCNVNFSTTIEARADVPLGGYLVTAEPKLVNKVVECYGCVFSNNFITAVSGNGTDVCNLFRIWSGENVFCGEVKSGHINGHYWKFADNNTRGVIDTSISAVFKGGYVQALSYGNRGTHFSPYANGITSIEEKPLSVVRMFIGKTLYYRQELNLNVASNVTTRGIHILRNSTLNTTVADALYATDVGSSGVLLNDLATWNLSADQGVNVFGGITNTATVASQNGATLHLRDDRLNTVKEDETQHDTATGGGKTYYNDISLTTSKVQTNKVVFAGNVNFSKEGILDHFMEGVSTSTGSVTVKKGRMIFTTGSWQNASGVSVSDGGTLELRNANAFGRDTPVSFTGENTDGMLVIPSGTTVKLRNVTVNGVDLTGMISSGLVTGGGTLAAGKLGMSIIFR